MLIPHYKTGAVDTVQANNVPTTNLFSKSMDLHDATLMLRRHMRLIVSTAVAFSVLALLLSFVITPKFQGSAVVLLEPRHTDVVKDESVLSSLPADTSVLRSEMDIIQSRTVVDHVIDKLDLLNEPEFNKTGFLGKLNPFNWFSKPRTEEEKLARHRTAVAEQVLGHLDVTNDGRSYSIYVNFSSESPARAALIANTFADEYIVDQLENKYDATTRANKWLNERLSSLKQQVEASEHAVSKFREAKRLILVNGDVTIAEKQMDDITTSLNEARTETSQAEARLNSARVLMRSKGGMDSAANVLASPLIQNLREQEAEVRRTEAEMSSKYGDLHPKVVNARAQYKELETKIGEEVSKVLQGLVNEVDIAHAKEAQLKKELQELEDRAVVEMQDSVNLRQLEREAEANRVLYENFLNRYKETSQEQDLQIADSRIIARADAPLDASFPKKWLFALMGFLMGGVVGVFITYLMEYFDYGFRNAAQVEEMTGLPVIGLVPSLTESSELRPQDYVMERPLSAYSESLRTVRTAIHLSNVDKPPKVVLVTSSVPGEGKTSFCTSLGRAQAKQGNKVLIIDADLRRPRIASALSLVSSNGGLAAILMGSSTIEEVLQHDPVMPGLDIIPANENCTNAQDLLGSQRMQQTIQDLSTVYDLIIIDSPPILAVSDAAVAARVADTTVFLIHWGVTPRDQVMRAVKQLSGLGTRIAGIAMSQVIRTQYSKYEGYYKSNYDEYYSS